MVRYWVGGDRRLLRGGRSQRQGLVSVPCSCAMLFVLLFCDHATGPAGCASYRFDLQNVIAIGKMTLNVTVAVCVYGSTCAFHVTRCRYRCGDCDDGLLRGRVLSASIVERIVRRYAYASSSRVHYLCSGFALLASYRVNLQNGPGDCVHIHVHLCAAYRRYAAGTWNVCRAHRSELVSSAHLLSAPSGYHPSSARVSSPGSSV
jgi:hypothetical protein